MSHRPCALTAVTESSDRREDSEYVAVNSDAGLQAVVADRQPLSVVPGGSVVVEVVVMFEVVLPVAAGDDEDDEVDGDAGDEPDAGCDQHVAGHSSQGMGQWSSVCCRSCQIRSSTPTDWGSCR